MSEQSNKETCIRFHDEVINGLDFELAREILSPTLQHARGAIGYTINVMAANEAAELRGKTGADRFIAATKLLRSCFPEWVSTIKEIYADGDTVVSRCIVRGRDRGGFLGSGLREGTEFELEQVVIQTYENGRIVKIYALSDELSFWRALGAQLPA